MPRRAPACIVRNALWRCIRTIRMPNRTEKLPTIRHQIEANPHIGKPATSTSAGIGRPDNGIDGARSLR
jgi:hypothetical protein